MRTATVTVDGATLTLSLPDGLEASPIRGGLAIRPPDAAARRGIYEMAVTLGGAAETEKDASTTLPLDRVRGSGAEAIRYSVRREDGGSGGEEMTLIAVRRCAGGVVRLRFDAQSEDGDAIDLEPAFAVLESARCTSGG